MLVFLICLLLVCIVVCVFNHYQNKQCDLIDERICQMVTDDNIDNTIITQSIIDFK